MRVYSRKGLSRTGQSLIETCLAMFMICLVFCGLLQISQIFAAREVLQYAAARGARAKTVGFNEFMVRKVINVAAIPNSGKMLVPQFQNTDPSLGLMRPGNAWSFALNAWPASDQYAVEKTRIPDYLASRHAGSASSILDYENWGDKDYGIVGDVSFVAGSDPSTSIIHVETRQKYRLWVQLRQLFYAGEEIMLTGDSYIENHYPLYLTDEGW